MQIGVVGKPNVGKSTFFKAATLAEVEIANYPFATIKPNSGVGYVKINDAAVQFGKTSNPREGFVLGKSRFVPVQMVDVAGLVPGAHEGKGMGNQFMNDLSQADVLIHVVDISGSTNDKGEQVDPPSHDPADDIKFLEEELDYWILALVKKGWDRFSRGMQQTHIEAHIAIAKHLSGLGCKEELSKKIIEKLNLKGKHMIDWDDDDLMDIAKEVRKETKPMIIACNKIDVKGAEENYERIKKQFPDYTMIKCSAESELALREAAKHGLIEYIPGASTFEIKGNMNEKQKAALGFIKENILGKHTSTGVQNILDTAVFEVLGYIAIFPGGVAKLEDSEGRVLPDCFLMPPNSTTLDFAFRLHTDFGKRFIRAIDVKTKRAVGKEHRLIHEDVVEIVADA
ncbi:redox-regulated ATPase YchF [Candidatus Woesearchaeota archaeon]|nr:redox-regulated ATPase YchF [Candidatus Woesearchaeota archaeon]